MELYCIKTHPIKAVIKGNIYPLIGTNCPCKCKDLVNVGIKFDLLISIDGRKIKKGETVRCKNCWGIYIEDGIWWIHKNLFANIDAISLEEVEEVLSEKLIEV